MPTYFTIHNSKIVNTSVVREAFNLPNGKYELTIKANNQRSLQQNKFWWGGLIPQIQKGLIDIGYGSTTKEFTHELIKKMFVVNEIVNVETGEVLQASGSTTELSKVAFMELIDKVALWAAEYLGITVIYPEQQILMFED